MLLPYEINEALIKFLNPKITFASQYNQYLYNDKGLLKIDEEYLKKESLKLLVSINQHLQQGISNKVFLSDLLEIISKKFDWFAAYPTYEIKSIDNLTTSIKLTNKTVNVSELKENFRIDDIVNNTSHYNDFMNKEDNYYAWHMERFLESTNNFEDPLSFEKAKLLYVFDLLKESLEAINDYIDSLQINFEFIDFKDFDYEDYLFKNGFKYDNNVIVVDKGHFAYSKIDVANLFYFLKDEKILQFHSDDRKDGTKMNRMIERNFTYKSESGSEVTISNINKEISKVSFANPELHLNFLNRLIEQLEKRRNRLTK